jgi:integrase
MSIYKRGETWWFKFMLHGQLIRESTDQGNYKVALGKEAARRTSLEAEQEARAKAQRKLKVDAVALCEQCEQWFKAADAQEHAGRSFCTNYCLTEWVKKHRVIPTLAGFLKDRFEPFVKADSTTEPKTRDYYLYGTRLLLEGGLGDLLLNEITSEHSTSFLGAKANLSPSTQNCGLRTLRRALNLAEKWGVLDRAPELTLTKEKKRERVVPLQEFLAYRELCRVPWRDVATVLYGTGCRPDEVYCLRWENVALNGTGGIVQIVKSKTEAGERFLPMVPEVYATLKARHEAAKSPKTGWVFPAGAASGHVEEDSIKHVHRDAVKQLEAASVAYQGWVEQGSIGDWVAVVSAASNLTPEYLERHAGTVQGGFKRFPPYCLRHSALTALAAAGADAFTLARIAGHSSISITQRYIHPQHDAIERAFQQLAIGHTPPTSGHKIGHTPELPENAESGEASLSD